MAGILKCTNKKLWQTFEKTPEFVLSSERYYVPPFPGSIVKIIDDKSFFKNHGEIHSFLAMENGQVVGRISAIINHSHNKYLKDKVGFIGYFDCINDLNIAKQLFETAEKELKQRGMDTIRGPYNPSIHDECGILVEGFDSIPSIMMPYNPPYYEDLYRACGYEPVRDLFAFYFSVETEENNRIIKIVDRVQKRSGVTLRNIDLKKLDTELLILKQIYNNTLDRNFGFYPITQEDVEHSATELKALVDQRMVFIAEKDGKTIGFSLCIPNINEILWKVKSSKNTIIRILRFLWHFKLNRPKEARLVFLGVMPEYQNLGIAPLLYYQTHIVGRKAGYLGAELSWVEETNKEIIHGIEVMGGKVYKKYRLFEKKI